MTVPVLREGVKSIIVAIYNEKLQGGFCVSDRSCFTHGREKESGRYTSGKERKRARKRAIDIHSRDTLSAGKVKLPRKGVRLTTIFKR